jgi:hypothetical protein
LHYKKGPWYNDFVSKLGGNEMKGIAVHVGGSSLYECMECRSRLIEGGKCLTCDSVQIEIQKELKEKCFECKQEIKKLVPVFSPYERIGIKLCIPCLEELKERLENK